MKHNKCPNCSANLDPGEKCDCAIEVLEAELVETSDVTDIIVIKQLPDIEEHLQAESEAAQAKIAEALALPCSSENIQIVKKRRTELRRDFEALEEKRKDVDRRIKERLAPYTDAYKRFITDVYKPADATLKARIDALEDEKKAKMREEVKAYYDELAQHHGIDFASFETANINVTLSSSMKGLKEQAKKFIDKICDDLALIATQEHTAEILVEYKQSLNVSAAITSVKARIEAVEAQRLREEEFAQKRQASIEAVQKVEEALPPPAVEAPLAPPTEETAAPMDDLDRVLTLTLPPIIGRKRDLIAFKRFIEQHLETVPLEFKR